MDLDSSTKFDVAKADMRKVQWLNLALAQIRSKQLATEESSLRRALDDSPDDTEALFQLAACLLMRDEFDEASACLERVLGLDPKHDRSMNTLGTCRRAFHQLPEAEALFKEAIALKPDEPRYHINLAHLYLGMGDFEQGWREYEWRLRNEDCKPPTHTKAWTGEDLAGRTVFAYAEQGFGDTFQFVRYLPRVKALGARVVFQTFPRMNGVLSRCAGFDVLDEPPTRAKMPPSEPCDYAVSLMSLPALLGTTLETIPADIPYLFAEPDKRAKWQMRLDELDLPDGGLKVGLAWNGSPLHVDDQRRSLPLAQFAPLVLAPGVTFFSLQLGPAARQAATPPDGMTLIDWTADLNDFDDTAALIASLDLVITVDTALAHLAGALGKPVWTLLSDPAEWRWMEERSDSPWYPTMRLFRQPKRGDWAGAMELATIELQKLAAAHLSGHTIDAKPITPDEHHCA